jgi:hypothetical protein
MSITITEALAEIKTVAKRIEKKRDFIRAYLSRQEGVRDPLEKQGGSFDNIAKEQQSIMDLENRIVTLRRGIQVANETTTVTINGTSRTISDWLVWRREAAPMHRDFLNSVRQTLNDIREGAKRKGANIINASVVDNNSKPTDIIVNIDEARLANDIEQFEITLGQLDGVLSLKNATVAIKE